MEMGRSPCCDKVGLKKGPWTPEEDQKLLAYIEQHGHGSWRALPPKAGLQRCGKSCRLRWINYLRPDIKRGKFSPQEEQTIIQLHALLGNRWSAIATHLPKRTDNEIKNYWNTHLKKRLTKMGIDPVTHKPKNNTFGSGSGGGDGQSKDAANLSHIAQWESARLEAEARLVRQSKIVSNLQSRFLKHASAVATAPPLPVPTAIPCLDILKVWQAAWVNNNVRQANNSIFGSNEDLESPTSILNFPDNMFAVPNTKLNDNFSGNVVENNSGYEVEKDDWNCTALPNKFQDHAYNYYSDDLTSNIVDSLGSPVVVAATGLPELPACNLAGATRNQEINVGGNSNVDFGDNKSYWNNILSSMTSFTSGSVF